MASFVDVPGHERFVRNMLAGAHGIDAALLVVAADESVMPQTREHFEICRLLGIPRGLVALTKCDLADAELQAAAELETRELVAGSFLEGQPVVRVSAVTGEGLDALRRALLALARETPPRSSEGLLRLPVDRVFSIEGLRHGRHGDARRRRAAVRARSWRCCLPGRRARVRGLQVHGESVERAPAGTRTAVNLAGVEVDDVARGHVLVRPGTLRPTSMIDVELSLLAGARPLRDGARVRVHVASAEALGRVALLGAKSLEPGTTSVAQLRLETPVVAGRGDRLVLRSYSPAETIGGARVLDPLPPRRTAADAPRVERLRGIAPGAAAEVLVDEAGARGLPAPLLAARLAVPWQALLAELRERPGVAVLGQEPSVVVSRRTLDVAGAAGGRGPGGVPRRAASAAGDAPGGAARACLRRRPPRRVRARAGRAGGRGAGAHAAGCRRPRGPRGPALGGRGAGARRCSSSRAPSGGPVGRRGREPRRREPRVDARLLERVARVLVTERVLRPRRRQPARAPRAPRGAASRRCAGAGRRARSWTWPRSRS